MSSDLNGVSHAELIEEARRARLRAYAPYSHFMVGAALITTDGQIFHGCNVENAAYGSTICAERSALVSAYSAGFRDIVALAVVADTKGPVSPCGSCRQMIYELAGKATIIMANMGDAVLVTTAAELLPYGLDPHDLPHA